MAKVVLDSVDYFALVLLSGDKAIFVRESIDSLFHFPGCRIKSKKEIKSKLAYLLSKKYEGRVEIIKILEPVYAYSSKTRTSLSLILAKEVTPIRFPSSFESRSLSLKDKNLIDPLDYKGLEKALIYSKAPKNTIGLDELNKLEELKKALDFYSPKIAIDEIREVKDFIDRSNDLDSSIKAFLFLLRENNLTKESYLSCCRRRKEK